MATGRVVAVDGSAVACARAGFAVIIAAPKCIAATTLLNTVRERLNDM